jgi:glycosyltransferase involved in cell wall biosynthesis
MVRQLRAEGWECHVAIGGPPRLAAEYAAAGAVVHIVPMQRITTSGGPTRWLRYLAAWPTSVARLAMLARQLDVDLVHTNTLHSWYGWAAAAVVRRPHIWQAREIVVQSNLALRVERTLTSRFAHTLVATSAAVASQFDHPRLRVIFDEPDPDEFDPAHAGRFRRRVGIADDVPLVASVGRIDTWKGIGIFLDAAMAIRAARPDVELLVAGPTVEGKERYAASMAARAAERGVRWLGGREDVAELMADLDVYVMASTEPEPFGLGLVEALASGTPSVATAAGGPVEIVADLDDRAARLVPPGDPEALAAAVVALLPVGGTSTSGRRARPRLRTATMASFSDLFTTVLADQHRAS